MRQDVKYYKSTNYIKIIYNNPVNKLYYMCSTRKKWRKKLDILKGEQNNNRKKRKNTRFIISSIETNENEKR